jgi:hypothetical protein
MKSRILPFLAAGCVVVLVVIAVVVLLFAAKSSAKETNLTFICGGNATVSMRVHGTALLPTAALWRSNCSVQAAGSSVVIQCPALDISAFLGKHSAIAGGTLRGRTIG